MAAGDLITKNGQYEFNGLLLNDRQATYELIVTKVEGLFPLPDIKSVGDNEDDFTDGGRLGEDLVRMRTVTMDISLTATTETIFHQRLQAMRDAFAPVNLEIPLVYRRAGLASYSGLGHRLLWARPRRFGGFASDYEMAAGVSSGAVQFTCADPRSYDLQEQFSQIIIAAAGFNNSGIINNSGTFRGGTYPKFVIYGPATNPRIAHTDLGRTFRLDNVIPAGSQLEIDTYARTAQWTAGGGYVDWREFLRDDNEWFNLTPGDNHITYSRSNNPANTSELRTYWRPAWL